jgi:dihydroorotase-like cyclic amidohydrolase
VSPPDAARPDLVLRGGRVIDPASGFDGTADVAVRGGVVSAVGRVEGDAGEVLDASGLVVTAGFVDLHSHAQNIPSMRLQARDGVTTALELEAGVRDVAAALRAAADEGRPVNYGFAASWAAARMRLLDGDPEPRSGVFDFTAGMAGTRWREPADRRTLTRILARLEEEVGQGALGIGVLLGYAPDTDPDEYLAVVSRAHELGVPAFTHARSKPGVGQDDLDGVSEVIRAAEDSGAHLHLCHVNSTALRAVDRATASITGAQQRGVRLSTEAYPYLAGMTAVGAPFLHPDGLTGLGVAPADLRMVATGERPETAQRLHEIRESDPTALVVVHYLDEDDVDDVALLTRALATEDVAVASDAISFVAPDGALVDRGHTLPPGAMTHPRSVGTFSRFLRVMVRDTGLLSMSAALRRCSLLPASILASSADMRRKGRLQIGYDADLVAFDPDGVSDRATYQRPAQPSVGMRHVIVAGVSVVRDGQDVPEALPGRPVRGDP